jgi:hypothetical protein
VPYFSWRMTFCFGLCDTKYAIGRETSLVRAAEERGMGGLLS